MPRLLQARATVHEPELGAAADGEVLLQQNVEREAWLGCGFGFGFTFRDRVGVRVRVRVG